MSRTFRVEPGTMGEPKKLRQQVLGAKALKRTRVKKNGPVRIYSNVHGMPEGEPLPEHNEAVRDTIYAF